MHILHLIKTSEGATWAIRLLEELKIRDKNITFSAVIPAGGKHFKEYKDICEHVYEFDFKININILKNGKLFRGIVLHDNPDIIHSWFTQTTLYTRLFLRDIKKPRIFQVVGPAHLENILFRNADIKGSQNTDYWIATSKYIFNKYKNSGIPIKNLYLNYAFIDIKKLLKSKNKIIPRDFRKEFNLDKHIKIIGTASYIYPPKFYEKKGIKGHEYLLQTFEELLQQRNDVVLVIAGTSFGNSSYEEKLKLKAKEISPDKIFFTGKFNNIYEVISNFDVFVYLSKSENLGGVYESLLFEIPTVSSNKGGLPELVINDKTGYNVDPKNIKIIVEKINLLLETNYLYQRNNGKELVIETFNKEAIINETIHIYNKILQTPVVEKEIHETYERQLS